MKVGALDVQVTVLVFHKEPRRETVDRHADACGPGDGAAHDRLGMQHAADTLGDDDADGDQQNHGIEQRDQHRALLVAVGVFGRGPGLGQPERQHGQQQAGHVGEVVPGVGQQAHRTVAEADGEFDDDEAHIEGDTPDESLVERGDRMIVVMVFVCHDSESVMVSLISESSTSLLTMA